MTELASHDDGEPAPEKGGDEAAPLPRDEREMPQAAPPGTAAEDVGDLAPAWRV